MNNPLMDMLLEAAGEEHRGGGEPETLTGTKLEATLLDLHGIKDAMQTPCPYKVGDVVTPKTGANTRGVGLPHVVVEVLDPPMRRQLSEESTGSPDEAELIDVRVATVSARDLETRIVYAMGSWKLEPWVHPDEAAA
jgi:hypothetical protein